MVMKNGDEVKVMYNLWTLSSPVSHHQYPITTIHHPYLITRLTVRAGVG
jgi:hypothetical protein